jgi:hypothetical protein
MVNVVLQRCFNHAAREAAARCPQCGRFFCRECVTEHEGRVLCAACVRLSVRVPLFQRSGWRLTLRAGSMLGSFLLAWLFFYLFGMVLLQIPSSFHEGTVWTGSWLE